MSNLLSIETAFLNRSEIKQALNLQEVRSLQRTITNGQKKKFEQTLQLSKAVLVAVQWYRSAEGKAKLNEEGIEWSTEEFGNKVFGWQKSYFYKVIKAGELQAEVVETFKAKCDEVEAEGQQANRSLEGLLKYAKQVETGSTAGGQGEAGESEEGESEQQEAQVEVRPEVVFTLSFKRPEGNVSVRITSQAEVKTTNSRAEIEQAIAFLIAQLPA